MGGDAQRERNQFLGLRRHSAAFQGRLRQLADARHHTRLLLGSRQKPAEISRVFSPHLKHKPEGSEADQLRDEQLARFLDPARPVHGPGAPLIGRVRDDRYSCGLAEQLHD